MNVALSLLRRAIQCLRKHRNSTDFELYYDCEWLINNIIIDNCQQTYITQYFP